MNIAQALTCIENLKAAVSHLPTRFDTRVLAPEQPIADWLNSWRPTLYGVQPSTAPEIMNSFGVYLLGSHPDGEVLYVGKATPGARADTENRTTEYHLAGRMFMHLGQARRTDAEGLTFHDGELLKAGRARMTDEHRACVRTGHVVIALVEIDPWPAASFVETYLQAAMYQNGGLPPGNSRIG